MLASVRWRLTLWHSAVLAVLLALFAGGAYAFIVRASRERTAASVLDAAGDLQVELLDERRNQATTLDAAREVLGELRFRSFAFVVYDGGGHPIAVTVPRSRHTEGEGVDPSFDVVRLGRIIGSTPPRAPRVVTLADPEGGYRAAIAPVTMPEGRFFVAAAASLHEEEETLSEARWAALVAIPLALFFGGVGGSLLARRSLEPMVTMTYRAARIGATNLGDRLPIANPNDEVGRLATVINALLSRLERAFTEQRQFMADASHELRTPVAVVQHEASLALSQPGRAANEYEDSLRVVRDAGRRMRRLVDDLFLLARADAGELPVRHEPLYLNDVVSECARQVRSLAEARGVCVEVTPMPEAPQMGDEGLLSRVVLNLLDNAIKHSPAGACATVGLEVAELEYRVWVEDTGPGIPPEVQPHVFERFVRADQARARDADTLTSGAGLGLAIAQWIAEAHGGRLELVRSGPAGTRFMLRLPLDERLFREPRSAASS
jgi:heavy metal sensor kinase